MAVHIKRRTGWPSKYRSTRRGKVTRRVARRVRLGEEEEARVVVRRGR